MLPQTQKVWLIPLLYWGAGENHTQSAPVFSVGVVLGGSHLPSLQCRDLNLGLVHASQALYHRAMPPRPHFRLQSSFPGECCYSHISFYPGPSITDMQQTRGAATESSREPAVLEPEQPRSRTIVCDLGSRLIHFLASGQRPLLGNHLGHLQGLI